MPQSQIDVIGESVYWHVWHELSDVKREQGFTLEEITRISLMVQTAFHAACNTRCKLDSTLRCKVETLITGGDYPED